MKPSVLVFGDSHTNPILQGFRALGRDISIYGTRLPAMGPHWPMCFHTGGDPLRFVGAEAQAEFKKSVSFAGFDGENLLDIDMPMVTSLSGMTATTSFFSWYEYNPVPGAARQFLSHQLLVVQLDFYYSHILDFYRRLAEAGKVVLFVVPPGLRSNDYHAADLFMTVREYATKAARTNGALVVDVTEATCDASGTLRREYWTDVKGDLFHGNAEWGKEVARECCRLLDLQDQMRQRRLHVDKDGHHNGALC